MRYFILTILFFLTFIYSFAQDYVKFVEPTEIKNIKFLKGEIYKKISDTTILFGKETIDIRKAKTQKYSLSTDLQKFDKSEVVNIINDNGKYKINLKASNLKASLDNWDTIKLVNENNEIHPFSSRNGFEVDIKDCGSRFRIIIPEYPSYVFYENDIPKSPKNEESAKQPQNKTSEENKGSSSGLPWWKQFKGLFHGLSWWQFIIALLFLIILIILLVYIYYFQLLKKKQKQPIKGEYKGVKTYQINKSNLETNPEFAQPQQNVTEIISQIQQLVTNILDKIEFLVSNNEDLQKQKIENLQKENESLKGEIVSLKKNIEQSNQKINELNKDLTQEKQHKQKIEIEKQAIESELYKYNEKVIFVEYLEPYARSIYDYYNYCHNGYMKALEYFQILNQYDSESALELVSVVSQFIAKFNLNIPPKINYWMGVINEIKDSLATANIDLIRSLKQLPNKEEKVNEFKRILQKEAFEKYSSSIFILTEEFSNLSKFLNDSNSFVQDIQDIENYFTAFKRELHVKTNEIGLEIKYVPLFEHYESYAAFTTLANQSCSLPYKNVRNIPRDFILEITKYGFGNEKTFVILA